jgi:hypothetical protein
LTNRRGRGIDHASQFAKPRLQGPHPLVFMSEHGSIPDVETVLDPIWHSNQ